MKYILGLVMYAIKNPTNNANNTTIVTQYRIVLVRAEKNELAMEAQLAVRLQMVNHQ